MTLFRERTHAVRTTSRLLVCVSLLGLASSAQEVYKCSSPDGTLAIHVSLADTLSYSVWCDGEEIVGSALGPTGGSYDAA